MIYKLKCRIKFHAIQLGMERGTIELCQGAAEWASKVLKRLGGSYKVDHLGTPALAGQPVFLPTKTLLFADYSPFFFVKRTG